MKELEEVNFGGIVDEVLFKIGNSIICDKRHPG